jgi:recombination associated protein RdgC
MGIFSSAASVTRYRVEGKIESALTETVYKALNRHAISEIDAEPTEKAVGWTSFQNPYQANFEGSSFVFGSLFVFALRIDRKSIPAKMLKKHVAIETSKLLAKNRRRFLSKDEKTVLKEKIVADLLVKIPSTPNVYDVLWDYERARICFFSNLRSPNEELETLFKLSFNLALLRVFPYTAADLYSDLSDQQRDSLATLSPTRFSN